MVGVVGEGSCGDEPLGPPRSRGTRNNLPEAPLEAAYYLWTLVMLPAMVAAATWIPSSSPPALFRALSLTSLVTAVVPVWSLAAVTLRAPAPPPVLRVAPLSKGGLSSAMAAVAVLQLAAGVT